MNPRASSFLAAALGAAAWCLAGLGGCSSASNGLGGNGHQTCASAPCPSGQTYQACTTTDPTTGACTGVSYSIGGQTFNCASCGDCSEAAQQVAAACEGSSGDGGSGSGGSSGGGSGSGSGGSSGGACSAPQACGTGGRTYEECTNLTPSGQCASIVYKTSDGHDFTCPGCTSCSVAAQQLATYCESGSSSGGDAGGNESCTSSVPCGSNGMTYQECTTTGSGGACESIDYKLSNGTVYTCASCSDCTAAVQSLDTFCQNQGTPTTNCTSWTTCGTGSLTYEQCTTSLNGACQSIYYETSDGLTYNCNSCSDCTSALSSMQNHCTPTTSCGSATACGSTGVTYQQCETSTGGSCTSIYYTTTDGHTYTCNTCSDCTSASSSLTSYCSSLTGTTCGTSTCTTGYLCCNCSGTEECLSSGGGAYTCASYSCQ